jgi:SAM-dependent methyltransferase
MWEAWGHLLHAVRTGKNAFRHVHGIDPWAYRSQHPEEQAVFDRAMTAHSHRTSAAIVEAFDFGRFRRIIDVGGGQGGLLASILLACGATRGVLFDQPQVVAQAGDLLRDAGVADRCEIVVGNFFESIPDGADACILKSVIHNWADAEAVAILQACRRAIAPDGRVLVVERLLAPANEGAYAKFFDLHMLVALGAQERTREEFMALLDAAGLQFVAFHPVETGLTVIEGMPR